MLKIQPAINEQLNEIVSLWKELMAIHKAMDAKYFAETDNSEEEYKQNLEWILRDKSQVLFVAIKENKIVGYITATLVFFSNAYYNMDSHCEVGDIMIAQDYQNFGIGKALLEEVKKWSQENHIKTIHLNVFSNNKIGLSFFENQGFQPLFHKLKLEF